MKRSRRVLIAVCSITSLLTWRVFRVSNESRQRIWLPVVVVGVVALVLASCATPNQGISRFGNGETIKLESQNQTNPSIIRDSYAGVTKEILRFYTPLQEGALRLWCRSLAFLSPTSFKSQSLP